MAAMTAAIITNSSKPGGDFLPHPIVKYTDKKTPIVRKRTSRYIFIYNIYIL
jgi:hypothetical protein